MNLYRSFGNLMETWLTEEDTCADAECLQHDTKDPPTPSSEMETTLRSESVDSGVETASCDTSVPATFSSVSTDNTEMEREELAPTLASQAPVFSSSSTPLLCPSRAEKDSTALNPKLEQALQRIDSRYQKALTSDEVFSQQPQASVLIKRHTSALVRGQSSDTLGLRRTVSPPVSIQPMSGLCRRTLSMTSYRQRSESFSVNKKRELSPAFIYLEQVCQKLEGFAREQMQADQAPQMEADVFGEHQNIQLSQAPETHQSESAIAEEDCHSIENTVNAEHVSSEAKQQKHRHFRQRSASDTTLAMMHLKKLNADCRGQHTSIYDLQEEDAEDQENKESTQEETKKLKMSWRRKIMLLKRGGSAASDTKSQQMQSSEKNSARRRLSQLLRRRDKTV
ncbi:uncharacterized protein LOC115789762 [Archocentrus centrarchus]|uniref:uncharacterized protein LOC115789762 n=1 Tax=Archocentrus centrarchus TaxID=63155 RepID=UPI0011EA2C30|nr:uncharacterized protein LOC115789762 [Archocentrus centrarchus]